MQPPKLYTKFTLKQFTPVMRIRKFRTSELQKFGTSEIRNFRTSPKDIKEKRKKKKREKKRK